MSTLTINGVNVGVQQVKELRDVNLNDQAVLQKVAKTVDGDGLDSVVFESNGKTYLGWGDQLNLKHLHSLQPGQPITAELDGKVATIQLLDDELNPTKAKNLIIDGVNLGIEKVAQLSDALVNDPNGMQIAAQTLAGDGYDAVLFKYDNKAYIAWGAHLNNSHLDSLQEGQKVNATLDGVPVDIFYSDNDTNSFGEGVSSAWSMVKNLGQGAGKMFMDEGWKIAAGGFTVGMFARWGGAKVATTAASTAGKQLLLPFAQASLGSRVLGGVKAIPGKAAEFAFGPAKELTGQAAKGWLKAGKWAAIIGAGAAVAGTVGMGIYGAARSQNISGIADMIKPTTQSNVVGLTK